MLVLTEFDGRILLAGDWHGSFSQADKVIRHAKDEGIRYILQLGDFGIWENDKPFLNQMQHLLGEWDMHLYFIDGNHENFPRLYEKKINEDGTRYVRDNITYIPRGYRWQWEEITFLALGGAASIDKPFRREGKSWWPEEYLTEEDILTAQFGGPVDVMFCHDSPAGAPNSVTDDNQGQVYAMKSFGADSLNYCNIHRQLLKRVTDVTTPRMLFHGHYHRYMIGYYVHGDEKSTIGVVEGLDEGIAALPRHTRILTLDDIRATIIQLDTME